MMHPPLKYSFHNWNICLHVIVVANVFQNQTQAAIIVAITFIRSADQYILATVGVQSVAKVHLGKILTTMHHVSFFTHTLIFWSNAWNHHNMQVKGCKRELLFSFHMSHENTGQNMSSVHLACHMQWQNGVGLRI